MAPNLELVTGSFFTGKSKAGSVLGEREEALSEALQTRKFDMLFNFQLYWLISIKKNNNIFHTRVKSVLI